MCDPHYTNVTRVACQKNYRRVSWVTRLNRSQSRQPLAARHTGIPGAYKATQKNTIYYNRTEQDRQRSRNGDLLTY